MNVWKDFLFDCRLTRIILFYIKYFLCFICKIPIIVFHRPTGNGSSLNITEPLNIFYDRIVMHNKIAE